MADAEAKILKVGDAVIEQATDDSLDNTNPVALRGAITTAAGAVLTILILFGYLTEADREVLVDAIGDIGVGLFVLIPILQGVIQIVITRAKAFSPKSAALNATVNASAASPVPTLVAQH